jgi:hypothetical protein
VVRGGRELLAVSLSGPCQRRFCAWPESCLRGVKATLGVADSTFRDWRQPCLDQTTRGEDEEPAATTATLLRAHISISTDLSRKLDSPSSYMHNNRSIVVVRERGGGRSEVQIEYQIE